MYILVDAGGALWIGPSGDLEELCAVGGPPVIYVVYSRDVGTYGVERYNAAGRRSSNGSDLTDPIEALGRELAALVEELQ